MVVTLKDIAVRANVSHATVSVVLNGRKYPVISEFTRQKVMKVAADLGYYPNPVARALATGRSGILAVWTPPVVTPQMSDLLAAIHKLTYSSDYKILMFGNPVGSDATVNASVVWPVDGILAIDCPSHIAKYALVTQQNSKPIVSIGSTISIATDCCVLDVAYMVRLAIHHLYETGKRHITLLTAVDYNVSSNLLTTAYIEITGSLGLTVDVLCVNCCCRKDAYQAIVDHVHHGGGIDAILAYNSLLAVGAVAAVRDLGASIPDDIAVVSCEGADEFLYQTPQITSIEFPAEQLAGVAWEMLCDRMRDPNAPVRETIIKPNLSIRGSSRKP
jgi:LacI family transcriptional regulator